MSPVLDIQRRMMELGRIRLGSKAASGAPQKLSEFRLTSASKALLDAAADIYGGTVKAWEGAPDEGYFELFTETDTLDVILPPVYDAHGESTVPYSQWYELWSGGGCQRRCDSEIETLTGKPCLCNPDERQCKVTTRVQVMLPEIPGLGVWRLESHGWNAATLLPGTLDLLARAAAGHEFIPAVLRLEKRSAKKDGKTHRFVVPVIDLPTLRIGELVNLDGPVAINAPSPAPVKPALPAAPEAPSLVVDEGMPAFGDAPELPVEPAAGGSLSEGAAGNGGMAGAVVPGAPSESEPPSAAQLKRLNMLVGQLRTAGHITTEQVWRAVGQTPILSEDGQLHWRVLRDTLTKQQASELIERLTKLEGKVAA